MEIKTCENYVLEELNKAHQELEELKDCIKNITRNWVVDDDCMLHIHEDIDMSYYKERRTIDNFILNSYRTLIKYNPKLSIELETTALSNYKKEYNIEGQL